MGRHGVRFGGVALLALWWTPVVVVAQSAATGIVVDRLTPMPGRRGNVVNLATAEIHPHLATDLGLTMHYVDTPLRLVRTGGESGTTDLVRNQLKADLAGTIGLFNVADVTVAMPVVLQQSGADLAALGGAGHAVRGAAAGDLRVVPKLQLLAPERFFGVGVAVMTPLYLPTGDTTSFNSDGSARGGGTLVIDWRIKELLVAANVGYEVRKASTALQYRSDDVIPWGVAAEVGLGIFDAHAFANVFGAIPTVANADVNDPTRSAKPSFGPVEALAGLRASLPLGFSATVAGGMGLTAAVGAPEYRLLAGLAYAFDVFAQSIPQREQQRDALQVVEAREAAAPGVAPAEPVVLAEAPEVAVVAAPAAPVMEQLPAEPRATLAGERIEFSERLQFASGSDVLLPASLPVVASVARVLCEHPEIERVLIEGHTDDQGDAKKNLLLSKARAAAVLQALIREGIDAVRLASEGYGATRPLVPNRTAKQRSTNRRVEIRVESTTERPLAATHH